MKKLVFIFSVLIAAFFVIGCSNDDQPNVRLSETDQHYASDPNSIIGTWELKMLRYSEDDSEMPLDQRDIFVFNSKGKVKVIKKMISLFSDFPNEDGEYDYSFDKEKQIIQLCGVTRECIISDGEMYIKGYSMPMPDGEPLQYFVLIKK